VTTRSVGLGTDDYGAVGPPSSWVVATDHISLWGLENAEVRKAVCDILEGGESTFQERARRLRVRLDR
jgi:hypothetical protein